MDETGKVIPAWYQPPLPLDKLLLPVAAPGAGDRMELDVWIVGAGPAGLACAIELARVAQREHTDVNIGVRSEEHTSELQSQSNLVCRLLLEKKKKTKSPTFTCSGWVAVFIAASVLY